MIEKIILNDLADYKIWKDICLAWYRDFDPDIYSFPRCVYYCMTEANGYPVVYYLDESLI